MTKQAVKRMIKAAKTSAKDKAMELAANLGKPTSTGVVTGAGLGTILAAIGALSRAGVDPEDQSVLSNPLLLGTLGTTGGYLAGNAFERNKSRSSTHEMSWPAMLGLTGGVGTIGTLLANEDAESLLKMKKQDVDDLITRFGLDHPKNQKRTPKGVLDFNLNNKSVPSNSPVIDPATGLQKIDKHGKPVFKRRLMTADELKEFQDARKELAEAYIRAGDVDSAVREAGLDAKKSGGGFFRWLRSGRTSPWSWMKSLNPFKDPVSNGGEAGLKLLKTQLGRVIRNNPRTAGLAGLALLAGGGKAIYDYTKD